MGPHRVWLRHCWVPGLAMSRALGDRVAKSVGVTGAPEHTRVTLSRADRFMVLASDGVWEFISSAEAVGLVAAAESEEHACRLLVEEAHARWMAEEAGVVDDITAVVVRFVHPPRDSPPLEAAAPTPPSGGAATAAANDGGGGDAAAAAAGAVPTPAAVGAA